MSVKTFYNTKPTFPHKLNGSQNKVKNFVRNLTFEVYIYMEIQILQKHVFE